MPRNPLAVAFAASAGVGLFLLCLLAATGCTSDDAEPGQAAAPVPGPYLPPHVVDTAHYRIRSAATGEQTQAVGQAVESLHEAYVAEFGSGTQQARLELVLYRDQAEFKANNRSSAWAEAYYREPRSYAYPGSGDNPHHWMLHEATHQLLRQASGFRLRRWINEGIASYFGAGTLREGRLDPAIPDPDAYPIWWLASMDLSGDIQADIDRGTVVPLAQIIEESGPPIAGNVNGYYIHYWSLAHYLMHGEGGKYRGPFLALAARGGDPREFRRLIGSYDRIQSGWYAHLRGLVQRGAATTDSPSR